MKILLTGCRGQVGWELVRALQPLGTLQACTREQLDIGRPDQVSAAIASLQPDVVVNAAAYTQVEAAETDASRALAVNAQAVGDLAEACRRQDALLVHFSTDYVFDGLSQTPYREDATPSPLNVYGLSKLRGDERIAASGCRHLVLRVGWIYSLRRVNFLKSILARVREGQDLRVVADQVGAPTPAWAIADTTARMLQRRLDSSRLRDFDGLVNLACTGSTSWHGFARHIIDELVERPARHEALHLPRVPRVEAIDSAALGTRARRPSWSCLDLGRLTADWSLPLPAWQEALERTLREA